MARDLENVVRHVHHERPGSPWVPRQTETKVLHPRLVVRVERDHVVPRLLVPSCESGVVERQKTWAVRVLVVVRGAHTRSSVAA